MARGTPGPQGATAEPWYGFDGAEHYELKWDFSIQSIKKNDAGTTGYCKIISRSSGSPVGGVVYVHLCSKSPCEAVWPVKKYGIKGPPMHVRLS